MLTTTPIDDRCRDIAGQVAAGQLDEFQARTLISEQLYRSRIAKTVAKEKYLHNRQDLEDLISEMDELLRTKVMQDDGAGLNLERLTEGASALGWARQLLRSARQSLMRNITTKNRGRLTLVDSTPGTANYTDTPVSKAQHVFRSVEADDADPGESGERRMHEALEWLESNLRHLRQNKKTAFDLKALLYVYDLPEPARPRLPERLRLRALLEEDETLAYASAMAMFRLADLQTEVAEADPGMMAIWDDYAHHHLEAVISSDHRVAYAVVSAALQDRPRPSRSVLRTFRASVKAFGTGPGWPRLAGEVVDSFIAQEFEAYSAFDTTGSDYRDERVAGHKLSCLKAEAVFSKALVYPGQRLGADEKEIYDTLERLIRSLTDVEVATPDKSAA